MSMNETSLSERPCATRQALVLARWEKNRPAWRDGGFFELRSHKRRLQETVGGGGDLWIVVSRPSDSGRLYTLSFRLRDCSGFDYLEEGDFGRHAVIGDSRRSRFFATSDSRLLLLALRFEPTNPINGPDDNQISNSLRVPRCLSQADVRLLKEYSAQSDRWSIFISYQRDEEMEHAKNLSDALQRAGISVFRDQETLLGGDRWWPVIKRAISRSRRFVVLIGPNTHRSPYVTDEIRLALKQDLRVIPILCGGGFSEWGSLGQQLASLHALDLKNGVDSVVDGLRLA